MTVSSLDNRIIQGNQVKKNLKIYYVLMSMISLFELLLFIRGLLFFAFSSYKHYTYMVSYVFLFTISIGMLLFMSKYDISKDNYKVLHVVMRMYSASITLWAVVISFLDMRIGNFPIVYFTVIVTMASAVILSPKFYLLMVTISLAGLIGLDSIGGFHYFVSSGEFINVLIFTSMAIIINRRQYSAAVKDFYSNEKLVASVLEERGRVSAISMQTILSISNAVDAKDRYTQQHSKRVSEYSMMIAKELGWDEKQVEELHQIALLHDIGKIAVSDAILNKPGKLTSEEYEIMKSHTTAGGAILKDLTILKNVSLGAMYHHERYDGKGYPEGLSGDNIPIEARIIAVADAFDAMSSNRVYRTGLNKEKIIDELGKGKGTQFDPQIVEAFMPYATEILSR